MRRSALLLVVALIASLCPALVFSDCAGACSCASSAGSSQREIVRQALSDSDAVFAGKVVDIDGPVVPTSSTAPETVEFAVSRVWKGPGRQTLEVKTAVSDVSCGYPFEVGESYVVYASGGEPSAFEDLSVDLCGGTKPLSGADDDLAALGAGKDTDGSLPETGGPSPGLLSQFPYLPGVALIAALGASLLLVARSRRGA